jgi:hypothetical protein
MCVGRRGYLVGEIIKKVPLLSDILYAHFRVRVDAKT